MLIEAPGKTKAAYDCRLWKFEGDRGFVVLFAPNITASSIEKAVLNALSVLGHREGLTGEMTKVLQDARAHVVCPERPAPENYKLTIKESDKAPPKDGPFVVFS